MAEGTAVSEPGYLTTEHMAARYCTSPSTVRYWVMTGYGGLTGVKVGRRRLFSSAEVERFDAWLAEQAKVS